ncbi:DUF6766 family protein [Kribbella flavida]|uniref:DUF6766 family protein n=1 Tax=Kribbella flavida TaxID=182640 RepID=UPI003B42E3F9
MYVLLARFLGSWIGQFLLQLSEFKSDQEQHGQAFAWADYWPNFLASTFENWQSEWLQLVFQAILLLGAKHFLSASTPRTWSGWRPRSTRSTGSSKNGRSNGLPDPPEGPRGWRFGAVRSADRPLCTSSARRTPRRTRPRGSYRSGRAGGRGLDCARTPGQQVGGSPIASWSETSAALAAASSRTARGGSTGPVGSWLVMTPRGSRACG